MKQKVTATVAVVLSTMIGATIVLAGPERTLARWQQDESLMSQPFTPDAIASDQTWSGGASGNNTAWFTTGNWAGGAFPGATPAPANTTNIDVATIGSTGTNPDIGINLNVTGSTLGLGAINFNGANRGIGNSSNAAGAQNGTLRLNGATVNGIANTILRNFGSGTLTLHGSAPGSGAIIGPMVLLLGNSTENVINVESSGGINLALAITGANRALTFNGTGAGVLTFSGGAANTYSGQTTVNVGELDLNKTAGVNAIAGDLAIGDGSGGSGTAVVKLLASNQIADSSNITITSDGTFDIQTFNETVGNVNLNGGSIVGTTGVLTGSAYNFQAGSVSANLGGTAGLTKATAGIVTLTGASTYTGLTTVNGGSLRVDGSLAAGSSVAVNSTGTLTGIGMVNGSVAINSGGTLSPGNSVGTIFTGATSYNFGGTYLWEINNATSAPGSGWDLNSITGLLGIGASSANPFTIDIAGLNGSAPGAILNFDRLTSYDWIIASASAGISGFDANAFLLASGNFTNFNSIMGSASNGWFSILMSGNDLVLHYTGAVDGTTGVPENGSTALFLLFGLAGILATAELPRRRPVSV